MTSSEGLDGLVDQWLTLPEVAQALGVELRTARSLLRDRSLLGVRLEQGQGLRIPRAFIVELDEPAADGATAQVVHALPGTLSVLADAGYDEAESIRWLFTPDDIAGGSPIGALRAGHTTEVRRRAQALGF